MQAGNESVRTNVAVDEPAVCRPPDGAADAHETVLFRPREQGTCRWVRLRKRWHSTVVERGSRTYPWALVGCLVGLDPYDVFTAAEAPFRHYLPTAFETFSVPTADPH